MSFELSIPTQTLLSEIGNPKIHQKDVAKTCAVIFLSGQREQVDWKAVNDAIKARWSPSGRERVLTMAWKMAEEAYKAGQE